MADTTRERIENAASPAGDTAKRAGDGLQNAAEKAAGGPATPPAPGGRAVDDAGRKPEDVSGA